MAAAARVGGLVKEEQRRHEGRQPIEQVAVGRRHAILGGAEGDGRGVGAGARDEWEVGHWGLIIRMMGSIDRDENNGSSLISLISLLVKIS